MGLKIVYKYRKINVHSKTYIYHIYIMYISPAGRVVYVSYSAYTKPKPIPQKLNFAGHLQELYTIENLFIS